MNNVDDLRNALLEDDGSLPERWNPDDEDGATLVGTLVRLDSIVTKLGPGTIAVIQDAEDGTTYGVLLGRSVLKKRWEQLNPREGDTIGLKYVGWVEPRNKDSQGYHNYVLRVLRNAAPPPPSPMVGGVPADDASDDELPF